MIRLKNVSKFYYSKGMIASGFSKVNLEFKVGEFVVITGESGSGKSTLLNVISGLDTYEEGELYIDGKETSHYTTEEFEEYRKKYIGNIFQNFNLVNSYSVYQNVELILLINGYTRTEIKDRVTEIIQKVGLREYTNTKVSKLSGGQKQRVAIARALAKETSIIVADEPTGNLDSTSAAGIVTLLREIAKDKLVVVVTHNFDQFADSATRIIKMHDGKVVEDKVVAEGNQEIKIAESRWGNISVASKLRLGIRNTFNVIPKFLLLLVVFMFVILAVSSNYTSFQKQEEEMQKLGYNPVFSNYTEDRIVVKKADGNAFTDEDYTKISDLANVKSLVKEDILMDKMLTIGGETFGFTGYPKHMNELGDRVDLGELPKAEGEVVLSGSKDDYTLTEGGDEIIGKTFKIIGESGEELSVTVSGIKYTQDGGYGLGNIYLGEAQLDTLRKSQNQKFSEVESLINDKIYKQAMENNMYKVVPNSMVPSGKAIVSEELNGVYSDQTAVGKEMEITVKNIYYTDNLKVKIDSTYNKNDMKAKTGVTDYEVHAGEIFVNPTDYEALFVKGNFQSSVMVKDPKLAEETAAQLTELGYKPLVLKNTLTKFGGEEVMKIIQVPLAVILVLAIFFISYFVIRLILKSRGTYFSTLRILGLEQKSSKRILDIELFAVMNIAYLIFLVLVALVQGGLINIAYIASLVQYLGVRDYFILYFVLILMSYLISSKFARSLFKKSAMDTYREEA